jgi:hypothetical protein
VSMTPQITVNATNEETNSPWLISLGLFRFRAIMRTGLTLRRRADVVGLSTETQSRDSVQPVCSAGYSRFPLCGTIRLRCPLLLGFFNLHEVMKKRFCRSYRSATETPTHRQANN